MNKTFTGADRGRVSQIKLALERVEKDYQISMDVEKKWLDSLAERFGERPHE